MPLYRSDVSLSVITTVELVAETRTNSGAGHRVCGPKGVLSFCCTCLKVQRRMLGLRV